MKPLAPLIQLDDVLPSQKSDIAICVIGANDVAMKQLDATRLNIVNYASKCGADYIELNGDKSPEWPMSNKYRLKQVIEKYEQYSIDGVILFNKKAFIIIIVGQHHHNHHSLGLSK